MKWQKTLLVIAVCSLLMGGVASTPDAAKPGKNSILEEYQRIQESNRNFRSFSYEEGAPQQVGSTYRDSYGYLWTQDYSTKEVYRFNGTSFTEILKEEPLIKKDSLFSYIIQTNDKSIYLATKHYLLRWNGYRFLRYAFPKDDRIAKAQAVGDKVLCVGAKGYGVLDSGTWKYVRIPIDDDLLKDDAMVFGDYFIILISTVCLLTLDSADYLIGINYEERLSLDSKAGASAFEKYSYQWDNDLILQHYTTQGKKLLKVLGKDEMNRLNAKGVAVSIEIVDGNGTDPYLYLQGTNLMFRIDGRNNRIVAHHYPEGTKILSHTTDKQGNIWICYVQNQRIFLRELADGISPSSMEYFVPNEQFDEACSYFFLLDDDTILEQNSGVINYNVNHIYRLNRGYPELSKCEFPEANLKGEYEYGGMYPVLDRFTHYACVSIPRKELPGVHRVYVVDILNGMKEYVDVSDPVSTLRLLDFNSDSRIMLAEGKNQLLAIPFRKTVSQLKAFTEKDNFTSIDESDGSIRIRNYKYDQHTKKAKQEYFAQREGMIFPIYKNDNGSPLGAWRNRRIYVADRDNSQHIQEVDVKSGYVKNITARKDAIYKLIPDEEGAMLLYNDFTIDQHSPNGIKNLPALGIAEAIMPTVREAGLTATDLLASLYPSLIASGSLYFKPLVLEVYTGPDGSKSLSKVLPVDYYKTIPPQKPEYVPGLKPKLCLPAYTCNLQDGKLTWQPRWMQMYNFPEQAGERRLIKHWEGTKTNGRIRFSWFENGKLNLSASDFSVPLVNGSFPEIWVHSDKQRIYFEMNDQLYWLDSEQKGYLWRGIALADYKAYGSLRDVDGFSKDLWLTFDSALLRYNRESQQSFVFSARDGIPSDLTALYQEQEKFYLLSNSGVYHFTPEEVGATLMIPWLQANDSRFSSSQLHRFKHTQNNLIFPVDILNTLFPERMKLSYYLKGYDKEWKHRDYAPQIEYPQLRPGKYEFQIYGTSPTGRQSSTLKIPFRIKPPIYANGWAYLIYAITLFWIGRHLYRLRIKQLQQRNLALEKVVSDRTQELRERQQRLDESIDYASLIQKSILPQPADMAAAFGEHFVIWKPRDVLGGDFYWLHEAESGNTFLAVIDCTGHGVPAALLTMTVNSLLNNLIRDKRQEQLGQILETMHEEIGKALHQDRQHTQQDGFEIALVKWNQAQQSLSFAGAGLNLLYRRPNDEALQQLRGEKYGVGGLKWHKDRTYSELTLTNTKNMYFYLYTDGILDQLDEKDSKLKRLGHQDWISLLDSLAGYGLREQQRIIADRIQGMLHQSEQRDDISILGIKLD